MPQTLPPAPTYTNPVIVDETAKEGRFNPIWLDWFLRLKSGVNTLIGGYCDSQTIVDETNFRTALLSDACQVIEFTSTNPCVVVIEANSNIPFPLGTELFYLQGNTGQVTVTPGLGVTFETPDSNKTRKQESLIGYKQIAVDRWQASGDLEPFVPELSVLAKKNLGNGAPEWVAAGADGQALVRQGNTITWADPTNFALSPWPMMKTVVTSSETVIVPSSYQMIVMDQFTIEGTVDLSGSLYIL